VNKKIVIVGSGLFGLTIAHKIATEVKTEVVVLEKRDHIGGNAWSEIDKPTGIEIHKYGTHLFHTSNEEVWSFVNQFSSFNGYRHTVWANHKNNFFSLPINLSTMSQFYGEAFSPDQARERLLSETKNFSDLQGNSFEDAALTALGKPLYEAFIKGYTKKQWATDPRNLPSDVFGRLPIRFNFNNAYFNDKYQGLPTDGYFNLIKKLASNPLIKIETGVDFFQHRTKESRPDILIYSGPLDEYFAYKYGRLTWRTLDFEIERLEVDDYQGASVVNYSDEEVPFTRIHEFKHLHPERSHVGQSTVIMKEYSRMSEVNDEPYYPVNSTMDRDALKAYRMSSQAETNVIFGGRLGSYQYLDMHMAIASGLRCFENKVKPMLI
jgi:UDP-galactopyranose mutase